MRRNPSRSTGGLKLTVAGPMQPELLALQEAHDEWLRKLKEKKKKSPEAALAAFVDKSIPNLSSIVVLAELGGKRMLLTGRRAGRQDPGGNGAGRPATTRRQNACGRAQGSASRQRQQHGDDLLRAFDRRPLRLFRRRRARQPRAQDAWRCCSTRGATSRLRST